MSTAPPLLATKLFVPRPRAALVARPRLVVRLADGLASPLTLVCAPAGFGKTTLISEWHSHAPAEVAWLALDEDDNDPTRFLTYLVAALAAHQPDLGATALAMLLAPQPMPPKAILAALIPDLMALPAPLVLVLDDYHVIQTSALHEAMTWWLEHLPPQVRLIITSRTDPPFPLSRWRARGQLTEIRAADLRFTAAEAAGFLNQVMGLALSARDVVTLEKRTEGWIARAATGGVVDARRRRYWGLYHSLQRQ